jgi:beta-lactamase superfamily II metal-dependent hydrolase
MAIVRYLDVECGDTTIIESNGGIFLIDCYNIDKHVKYLPTNKIITAVFITHQHYDHFLGLDYLKQNEYQINFLIASPYTRRRDDKSVQYEEWNKYLELESYFEKKGTKIYKPYRQENLDKPWWTPNGLSIWIIGPSKEIADKDTRELHDASLVLTIKINNTKICFAGDASDENLNWVANNTNHYCDDILHASHHGSLNGADEKFIKNANIGTTIISTKVNVYPNIPHPDALKRYNSNSRIEVLRTDVSGTITKIIN